MLAALTRRLAHRERDDGARDGHNGADLDGECEAGPFGEKAAEQRADHAGDDANRETAAGDARELLLQAPGLQRVVHQSLVHTAHEGLGEGPEDVIEEEQPVCRREAEAKDGEGEGQLAEGHHPLAAEPIAQRAERRLQRGHEQPERHVHQQDVAQFESSREHEVLDPHPVPQPEIRQQQVRVVQPDVVPGVSRIDVH